MTKKNNEKFLRARSRFGDFLCAIYSNSTVNESIEGTPFRCLLDLAIAMGAGATVVNSDGSTAPIEIRAVIDMAESSADSALMGAYTYREGVMALIAGAKKALDDMESALDQEGD